MTTKTNITSKTTAKVAKTSTTKKAVAKKVVGPRVAQWAKDAKTVIQKVAKTNPHKGNLAIAFSLFRNGMTVEQYLEAVKANKKLTLPARMYLNYELEHKYVALKAA